MRAICLTYIIFLSCISLLKSIVKVFCSPPLLIKVEYKFYKYPRSPMRYIDQQKNYVKIYKSLIECKIKMMSLWNICLQKNITPH